MRIYNIGEKCVCWQISENVSESISLQILSIAQAIKKHVANLVLDVVPAYNSVAVHFCGDRDVLVDSVNKIISSCGDNTLASATHELLVKYDGMDLSEVLEYTHLSKDELIHKHTSVDYLVSMIGFIPYFPYLLGLDKDICVPRKSSPRLKIPAGSVGIGGAQTGVYPSEVSGGWNIIGNLVNLEILKQIRAGDRVRFVSVC